MGMAAAHRAQHLDSLKTFHIFYPIDFGSVKSIAYASEDTGSANLCSSVRLSS